MRFDANVSMLFGEHPFLERFERAREAGFSAVEFWWPSGENLEAVARAVEDSGLTVALFNFDAGDMPAGERGFAGDPENHGRFLENVPVALDLAERLGCRRLNALVGHERPGRREEQLALARENVARAADLAAERGVEVVVEAVNTFENGPFLLYNTKDAAEFVRGVGRENVKIQYDAYHMQRMEGNLAANLGEYIEEIGHFQLADSPGRNEPGTGEISFDYLLRTLEDLGYRGYVGLEYNPETSTLESLEWLPKEARAGEANLESLEIKTARRVER